MGTTKTYLVSHVEPNKGTNAAQAKIEAATSNQAVAKFHELYPQRQMTGSPVAIERGV